MTSAKNRYDCVVVGSGPNGLAAAITLARAGKSVLVIEARETVGGGTRSAELTLPGFIHDVCAAILPLTVASPFFRSIPLADLGVDFIHSGAVLAHPLDNRPAVLLKRSVQETAAALGKDKAAYLRLMSPLVNDWEKICDEFLGPFPIPPHHPFSMLRFGLDALWPAAAFSRSHFRDDPARALFAGMSAHAIQPLENIITNSFALVEGLIGHAIGWPLVRGGTSKLALSLGAYLETLGGEIQTGWEVKTMRELPSANATLFDLTPRQVVRIAGERLPPGYIHRLNHYRYGPGIFKIDYALNAPIPWQDPACASAATVHIGGSLDEIAAAERAVGKGDHPEQPFIILTQQSLFDPSRAPQGKQTAWAYCHVPNGSTVSMLERIEAQIERFAPGFQDCILARHIFTTETMERYNPNYQGGDINGGVQDWAQLFTRPVARWVPYSTPARDLWLCSSSTPPGGGVHGMAGYHAAKAVLKSLHIRIR
jgi:phytoene dehydrogenase-like protein